jgi:multidrug efflux pump subunit AcrA (membrane-fusion protein)
MFAGGATLTVIVRVAIQPVGKVYVIVTVPADTPVTTPVPATTVARVMFPLVQVPVAGLLDNVMLCKGQTTDGPEIDDGNGYTVCTRVTKQPVTGSR